MTDEKKPIANDWVPITDIQQLKRLGKLGEEVNELGAAIARCIIQGVDEREPNTGKLNREWLEDEIADVLTNIEIVVEYFTLDTELITGRQRRKREQLDYWHSLPLNKGNDNANVFGSFQFLPPGVIPKQLDDRSSLFITGNVTTVLSGEPVTEEELAAIDWQEGERSRFIRNTKVYRTYADYCDD